MTYYFRRGYTFFNPHTPINVHECVNCAAFSDLAMIQSDYLWSGSKCPDVNSLMGLCKAKCTVFKQRQILGETGRPHCAKTLLKDGQMMQFSKLVYFTQNGLGWEVFSCLYIQWKRISCKKPISLRLRTCWGLFFPTNLGFLQGEGGREWGWRTKDFPSAASNPSHMFLINLHKPQ